MQRAIGIVRVSQTNGREGESFASPTVQRERIEQACREGGFQLVGVHEELDISGSKPLDRRPGLSRAVAAIEEGRAEIVAAAYFDRLFRSLRTQAEVVERVEQAGGQVLAVDVGQVTNGSAAQWLSATMLGAVAEYHNRIVAEKSARAQARAVERGVVPWPKVTLGYRRVEEGPQKGSWEPVPEAAEAVRRAYELRASGAPIKEVRAFLRSRGHRLSFHGVGVLLSARTVLGEIHFGQLTNLHAFEPIVERDLFERVQQLIIVRGPRPNSDRILARLGVLRCGTCGSRMTVMTVNRNQYWAYRCPPIGDCPQRVTISAPMVERAVIEAVKTATADIEGRASTESSIRAAAAAVEHTRANYEAAMRAFASFTDQATVDRLLDLRAQWDAAEERLDQLGGAEAVVLVNAARDWDRLSLESRRALIRAVVERVDIAPANGGERISIQLYRD